MDIINKSDEELSAIKKQIEDEIKSRKPKKGVIYFHRSKEDNFDEQEKFKLTDAQMENFMFTGYEIEVHIEIDRDGNAYAIQLGDSKLEHRVHI